ncbi:hypothetical protein ACP3P8_21975, partial [Pseudomonas aeruginosa]
MASDTDKPIPANTFVASSLIFPSIRARTTSLLLAITCLKLCCSYIVPHLGFNVIWVLLQVIGRPGVPPSGSRATPALRA